MKPIRYGVIGLKGIGGLHVQVAREHPEIELVAVVDINGSIADAEGARLSVRAYHDYRDLLVEGLVDAVSICTPHHLLAPIACYFLDAGIHVFVEKPLAVELSGADQVVDSANASGRKVCVGFQHRTYRLSQLMKKVIDRGEIGPPRRVLWTWHEFRGGDFFTRDSWRSTWRESGGGLLLHQVSHQLDLMLWLFGQPSSVMATVQTQMHDAETDDFCSATITFQNSCVATLQMSINEPSLVSIRQVTGDKGVMVIRNVRSLVVDQPEEVSIGRFEHPLPHLAAKVTDSHAQPHVTWQTQRETVTHPALLKWMRPRRFWTAVGAARTNPPFRQGHALLMSSFVRAIREDSQPLVTAESARATVELIAGTIVSSVTGRRVDFPLDRRVAAGVLEGLKSGRTRIGGPE